MGGIGTVVYDATHSSVTTNQFGLFTLIIGQGGTLNGGNFSTIAWGSDTHFLEVFVNGNNMGASQFVSVPYAMHAATADSIVGGSGTNLWSKTSNKVRLTSKGDSVGIGTSSPTAKLEVLKTTSTGKGGVFQINNSSNPAEALFAGSNGSGTTIFGINAGSASAGIFQIANAANNSSALVAATNGGGPALTALNTGTGWAFTAEGALAIADANKNFHTVFKGGVQADDITYTLPASQGLSNTVLQNDGSGTLSWQSTAGTGLWSRTAPNTFLTNKTDSVGIGTNSPAAKLEVQSNSNNTPFIIRSSASQTTGQPLLKFVRADGAEVLWMHSDDQTNVFLGAEAGGQNTMVPSSSGEYNTFVGGAAGAGNTIGSYNTALGEGALFLNTGGNSNTAVGGAALQNTTGDNNTALGVFAGNGNTSGANNTFLGSSAGVSSTDGNYNTFIGENAGGSNGSGNNNTYLGHAAGANNANVVGKNTLIGDQAGALSAGTGNVFLGYQAGYAEAGSNKLYVANSSAATLLYGDFPSKHLGVGGTNANSTLNVNGSVSAGVRLVNTGASTLTDADFFVIVVGPTNTITLPAANTCEGRMYIIKTGSNTWNTNPSYLDTSGILTSVLSANTVVRLISSGSAGNSWQQW